MKKEANHALGYFYAILSALCYGVMAFLVHLKPGGFSPEQLVFIRTLFSSVVLLPLCYRELPMFLRPDSLFLWLRSASGAVSVILYFYTLQGTSSANGNLMFSSSPIFVSLMSWLLFRETVGRSEALGIAAIVGGNILLYLPKQSPISLHVGMLGLVAAFFGSIAFLSLGEATKKYSSSLIVFGFSVLSVFFSLLSPGELWKSVPLETPLLLSLAGICVLGLVSQISSTLSFAHLKSPVATALGRASIIFSGLMDVFIAHYRPSVFEWSAYFIVILGIYVVNQYRSTHSPAK